MANSQGVQLVAGKLSPEEAERLAASFRPAWELDDAPFAQGNSLSAADIDALGGGGLNAGIAKAAPTMTIPKPAHIDTSPPEAVIVDVEPDPPTPPPPQQPVAVAKPAKPPPPRPTVKVSAPPPAVHAADASDEYSPVKKSNKGVFIGVGALVAVILVGVGVKAMSGGDATTKPVTTTAAETSHTADEPARIPPPPAVNDTPPAKVNTTAAKVDNTPAPKVDTTPVAKVDNTPAPKVDTTPKPTSAPIAAAAPPKATAAAAPVVKPPTKPSKGSIVHDNPF